MNRCLAMLAIVLAPISLVHAQENAGPKTTNDLLKPSRDYVMLQFTYENWLNAPDSLKISGFGRGFNGYLCYDFPIKKSHFSFAAGIGVGTSNIYFKDQEIRLQDTNSKVRFVPETKDFKKFKLTTAYLEAPFELRFFSNQLNRNHGFKAAIGLRVGTLVGAHTKGKYSVSGSNISEKNNTRRYLETWRFATTLRLGWGNFSAFGSYNINSLFKDEGNPQVNPYSIGICISGL